jgi:hypothetical protein
MPWQNMPNRDLPNRYRDHKNQVSADNYEKYNEIRHPLPNPNWGQANKMKLWNT